MLALPIASKNRPETPVVLLMPSPTAATMQHGLDVRSRGQGRRHTEMTMDMKQTQAAKETNSSSCGSPLSRWSSAAARSLPKCRHRRASALRQNASHVAEKAIPPCLPERCFSNSISECQAATPVRGVFGTVPDTIASSVDVTTRFCQQVSPYHVDSNRLAPYLHRERFLGDLLRRSRPCGLYRYRNAVLRRRLGTVGWLTSRAN